MEQYGNTTTFNLESVLRQNILNSEYYTKTATKLADWQEVIDEIYFSVKDVEPWLGGNARGASTAFCLLYRFCQLKPSVRDVWNTLDHPDSPYIRAIGFLYLRYVCAPKQLWDWFKKYAQDPEEFQPSGEAGKVVTIGAFARDLLLDQYYFETIFPRIPKPLQNEIEERLRTIGLPTKAAGNAGQGGADRRGIDDGNKRPASVKASLSVAMGQRAPNRAGAREEGRGLGSSLASHAVQDKLRSPYKRDERERERQDDDRDRRERDRRRDDDRSRRDDRDRQQDDDRIRRDDRDRRRNADQDRRRDYDRDRRRGDERERDQYRERRRSRSRERYSSRSRDRRPSRSPYDSKRSGSRDARDVFRDSARMALSVSELRERYGDATSGQDLPQRNGKGVSAVEEVYRVGGSRR